MVVYRSKNILLSGVTLKRSPMWNVHPVLSENIAVDSIRIESPGLNNDGVETPTAIKNVENIELENVKINGEAVITEMFLQ